MAVPKRRKRLPGTYFVTSRTWNNRPLFLKPAARHVFIEALLHYRATQVYRLHAFVLMPDHFHLLLTPAASLTLERAVQHIKGGSAYRIGRELNFRYPVWQRGFSDHRMRNARDYEVHLRYIEQNPVKQKLAQAASEYPWCSASGQFQLDEFPQRLKPMSLKAHGGTAEAVP